MDHREEAWLEEQWRKGADGNGEIAMIVARVGDHVHKTLSQATLTLDSGVEGDRWSKGEEPNIDQQVSIVSKRVADLIGTTLEPLHTPGDNFVIDMDLSHAGLPSGTRLRFGSALLEVTPEPHTGCKLFRERFGVQALAWVNRDKPRRLRGLFCKVIEPGTVNIGDVVSRV